MINKRILIHEDPSMYLELSIDNVNKEYFGFPVKVTFDKPQFSDPKRPKFFYLFAFIAEIWHGQPFNGGTKLFRVNEIEGNVTYAGWWDTSTNGRAAYKYSYDTFLSTLDDIYILTMCQSNDCFNNESRGYTSVGHFEAGNVNGYDYSVMNGYNSGGYANHVYVATRYLTEVSEAVPEIPGVLSITQVEPTGTTATVRVEFSNPSSTLSSSLGNKDGKINIYLMNGNTGWIQDLTTCYSGDQVVFTGLSNDFPFLINAATYENDNTSEATAGPISSRTYKTTVDITDNGKSVKFNVNINNNYTGNISYWSNTNTTQQTAYMSEGVINDLVITGYTPGATVTVYAQPINMNDARGEATTTTWAPTEFEGMGYTVTGTTITMIPFFSIGTLGNVTWKASLGKETVTGTGMMPAKFKLLSNSTTYNIVFKGLYANSSYSPSGYSYETEDEYINQDVYYDVRTYGVQLKERSIETNRYYATIYQTLGAFGESGKLMKNLGPFTYNGYCVRRDGNIDSGIRAGGCIFDNDAQTVSVVGLEPDTGYRLYVYLDGINSSSYQCKDFEGYNDAVGYIDFTTKPACVPGTFTARVTGTTVTVIPAISRWNGSESLSYTVTAVNNITGTTITSGWKNCSYSVLETNVLTGLTNGTPYTLNITAHDNHHNQIAVNSIEVITYGISFGDFTDNMTIPYTRRIKDVQISYTDGQRSAATSQDPTRGSFVKWWIVDTEGNVVDGKENINCRRSNPNKFTSNPKLIPGTFYYLYAEVDGVEYEGKNDTTISTTFTTATCASNYNISTTATGETIGITPTWTDGTSPDNIVTCRFILSLDEVIIENKTTKNKDEVVWFTNLIRGETYDITFVAEDNEGNTTSDYIYYAAGQNGATTETTYKLRFEDVLYNTRSVRFKCISNRDLPPGKYIQVYLHQIAIVDNKLEESVKINWNQSMTSGSNKDYKQLVHNTDTLIKVRIQDMRDQNGNFDTIEEYAFKTKELTVAITQAVAHVDHVLIYSQAYADGVAYDIDNISNTPITFVDSLCSVTPVREGKGSTGANSGIYYSGNSNHIRTFYGLTGGREYYFSIGVTDGVNENIADDIITFWTLVELIRIYHNGRFWTALPFIYHTGEFYRAPAYVFGTPDPDRYPRKWWHTNPERDYPPPRIDYP